MTARQRAPMAAIVFTILVWASAFPGIRAGLREFTPGQLVVLRFLCASLFFGGIAWGGQIRRAETRDLPRFAVSGFLGIALYQMALNIGELTISAGAASLLVNTAPIWATLLAVFFLKERLRPIQVVGILLGFLGALVITIGQSGGVVFGAGTAWVLLASLAHGSSFIVQKPLLARYRPIEVVAYTIWFGTLFLLPFGSGVDVAAHSASRSAIWTVVYLGIGPAALAYTTWAHVLAHYPASRAVSILFLVPVCAFLIAWVWLGEVPRFVSLLGGVVAMTGVALVHRGREPSAAKAAVVE